MATPFLRLSFQCLGCGAELIVDKRLGAMSRYLAAAQRMDPVRRLRCRVCRKRSVLIAKDPQITTEIPTIFERLGTLGELLAGRGR
jgi:hypothetical protein